MSSCDGTATIYFKMHTIIIFLSTSERGWLIWKSVVSLKNDIQCVYVFGVIFHPFHGPTHDS